MSVQNPKALKCKNGIKNIYSCYINDVSFLLMMFCCEVHTIYILTKFVQLLWCKFA